MTLIEARQLLGVGMFASPVEITAAYRKRAYAVHPDRNPGNPRAGRRAARVNEAYALLKGSIVLAQPPGFDASRDPVPSIDDLLSSLLRAVGRNHDRPEWRVIGMGLSAILTMILEEQRREQERTER